MNSCTATALTEEEQATLDDDFQGQDGDVREMQTIGLESERGNKKNRLREQITVLLSTAGDNSSTLQEEHNRQHEEEEDDETLCIVCMTDARTACLVHGRTSHQVETWPEMYAACTFVSCAGFLSVMRVCVMQGLPQSSGHLACVLTYFV